MNKWLPSEKTVLRLLTQVGCSKKVVEHCKIVADFAVELAESCKKNGFEVNVELVRIGALLHDIGRSKTHRFDHGVVGAYIAREMNLPDAVVSIVERHVGSGIAESEAEKLGWPIKSYVPESLEERIVAYSDKLIEDSMRISFEMALERFRRDRDIPKASVERLKHWHEEFLVCLS